MSDKITCPNCSHEFDVEEALSGKIEAHLKKEFEQKLAEQTKRFAGERDSLEKEREAFQKAKERENELFKEKLENIHLKMVMVQWLDNQLLKLCKFLQEEV